MVVRLEKVEWCLETHPSKEKPTWSHQDTPSSLPHIVVRTQNLVHKHRSRFFFWWRKYVQLPMLFWPRPSSSQSWMGRIGWSGASGNFLSNISWEIPPNSMLYSNGAACLILGDTITFVSSKGLGNVSSKVGVRGWWGIGSFLQFWLFLIISISTEMISLFLSSASASP